MSLWDSLCHCQHTLLYTGTWNVHSLVEITECAVLLNMVLLLRGRWILLVKELAWHSISIAAVVVSFLNQGRQCITVNFTHTIGMQVYAWCSSFYYYIQPSYRQAVITLQVYLYMCAYVTCVCVHYNAHNTHITSPIKYQ